VSNSLRGGIRAGIVAGLGITAGCFVHVFAAALGVSALLATSAMAFNVLKWVGAAYLVWTGLKLLRAKPVGWASASLPTSDPRWASQRLPTLRQVFKGGFLCNVLNPKVAIFFLAFVPQFIAPEAPHKALAFIALGALFNINSIPINAGWALAAGWMARRESVQRGMHWLDRAAGAMFLAFGLKLALTDNPSR
jgi:threonine/homoserine/homoserine lactone efflux protein